MKINITHTLTVVVLIVLCLTLPENVFGQGQIKRKGHLFNDNSKKALIRINNAQKLSSKYNWDSFEICQDRITDLDLSVKWAGWNIDASSPEQEGTLLGWGDPKGKEVSIYSSKYPVKEPPMSICGDRRYDMAMVNWGQPRRLPTRNELEELAYKCEWIFFNYRGKNGFKLTGPNGNTLFLPITSYRSVVWDMKKKHIKIKWKYCQQKKRICYYSGELNSNGGTRKPLDCRPYCLYASTDFLTGRGFVDDNGLRSHGVPVRVVYAK